MAGTYLKIGLVSLLLLGGAYIGSMIYAMSQMSMLHLIMCSAGEGGTRIPNRLCEHYMKTYRGDETDMEELAIGGLDPILNGESKKKYEIAAFFIAKGLDVNGVNHYSSRGPGDVTPLHASVLYNDPERAKFLLDHGADVNRKSKSYDNMTPLQLAQAMQKKRPREDRGELIRLLSQSEPPAAALAPPAGR